MPMIEKEDLARAYEQCWRFIQLRERAQKQPVGQQLR